MLRPVTSTGLCGVARNRGIEIAVTAFQHLSSLYRMSSRPQEPHSVPEHWRRRCTDYASHAPAQSLAPAFAGLKRSQLSSLHHEAGIKDGTRRASARSPTSPGVISLLDLSVLPRDRSKRLGEGFLSCFRTESLIHGIGLQGVSAAVS